MKSFDVIRFKTSDHGGAQARLEENDRAKRTAWPWLLGSEDGWKASRPRPWIRWVDLFPVVAEDHLKKTRAATAALHNAKAAKRVKEWKNV